MQIQETSNKPQNPPQKKLTKIFNQQLTSTHYLSTQPKNQKTLKPYNKKNKQNYKLNTISLKEDKIHTLVSKHLTEKDKRTFHQKRKDPPVLHSRVIYRFKVGY